MRCQLSLLKIATSHIFVDGFELTIFSLRAAPLNVPPLFAPPARHPWLRSTHSVARSPEHVAIRVYVPTFVACRRTSCFLLVACYIFIMARLTTNWQVVAATRSPAWASFEPTSTILLPKVRILASTVASYPQLPWWVHWFLPPRNSVIQLDVPSFLGGFIPPRNSAIQLDALYSANLFRVSHPRARSHTCP